VAATVVKYALDANTEQPFPTLWYDDGSGNLKQVVENVNNLPSGITPVTGQFTQTGVSASFTPIPGRGFNVTIWGNWQGALQLNRSFDGGTTWIPVDTSLIQNVSKVYVEPEAGVMYQLDCTGFVNGPVNYRISQ